MHAEPDTLEAKRLRAIVVLLAMAIPAWFWVNANPRGDSTRGEKAIPRFQVDLNRASAQELELLPGFGPKRVQEIEKYRRDQGPFNTPDELDQVPGIGPVRMEQVGQSIIVVNPESPKE